ncbi:hypothetical protein WMY93_012014 [Mugilogobius chulae]|uniref:Uncharacterized protein n=1 Tax=Mugilogobius chulae TaxID=88201 RepID=A0AAW0PGF2_9GOBI
MELLKTANDTTAKIVLENVHEEAIGEDSSNSLQENLENTMDNEPAKKNLKNSPKKKPVLVEDVANKLELRKESEKSVVLEANELNKESDMVSKVDKANQTVVKLEQNANQTNLTKPPGDLPQIIENSPSKVVFLKPSGRPPLVLQRQTSSTKAPECEEDEGIHEGVHEGASDVSDSASECSDDSGLKMLTPTDDVPTTPGELKAHLCIFCDRPSPLRATTSATSTDIWSTSTTRLGPSDTPYKSNIVRPTIDTPL